MSSDITSSESEIKSLNKKIEQEKITRQDAVTDLIPGVGLIGGLVIGRHKRMIPGHSLASGIVSIITTDIKNLKQRVRQKNSERSNLQSELLNIRSQRDATAKEIKSLREKSKHFNREKKQLDLAIKAVGKKVTSFQNLREDLLIICNKYQFLGVKCNQLGKIVLLNKPTLEEKQLGAVLTESRGIRRQIVAIQSQYHRENS